MTDDTEWHTAAKAYLQRLGVAEYQAAMRAHKKAGRRPSTYRHTPSAYMCDLINCLDTDDEERFKAIKMLEGHASAAGV